LLSDGLETILCSATIAVSKLTASQLTTVSQRYFALSAPLLNTTSGEEAVDEEPELEWLLFISFEVEAVEVELVDIFWL
jgi:hypothetical protein